MNQYKVVASDATSAIVAIEDSTGHCHVGRELAVVPKEGDLLRGPAPGIGVHPMRFAPEEEPSPVVIVLLDCDPCLAMLVFAVQPPERTD